LKSQADIKKKNAARSPYAVMAESDRHKKLKGLFRILRNFGRGSCLLKKYLILLEKSGFISVFIGEGGMGFLNR